MTTLIVLGNTNEKTFANSIVAANAKSRVVFNEPLTRIHVIHSSDSRVHLHQVKDWEDHIAKYGVTSDLLEEALVDITDSDDSIQNFVRYLERTFKGRPENAYLMVDLTNGTSFQKTLLSVAAYVLDVRHQYMIDIVKLSERTKDRGYHPAELLVDTYVSVPNSTILDNIAYLSLSEVVRYKAVIADRTKRFAAIDPSAADDKFFSSNLAESIALKLRGDQTRDNATYRIAASSISGSVEELISLLIRKHVDSGGVEANEHRMLGQKLQLVFAKIEEQATADFDLEFLRKFNDFMLYLRNSATHKGKPLTDLERFKADLSVKMSFPFIDFYTDIVYRHLKESIPSTSSKRITRLTPLDVAPHEMLYYGLDGDNTGAILEELFLSSSDEAKFRRLSESVSDAISRISKFIAEQPNAVRKAVVFKAGDDLLFKGNFDEEALKSLQRMYSSMASGLTCSIGYGRSFQEVYVALKFAKSNPGKNAIVGVSLS